MRGDETRPDPVTGGDRRTGEGPRHAAPRKSLLTKLHIPAGKAFALAAMPTAVLVGMGLTPRLALADDRPDIPFAPGPCVTRSDEPGASPQPSQSPRPSESPSPESSPPESSPSPSGTASDAHTGAEPDQGTAPGTDGKTPDAGQDNGSTGPAGQRQDTGPAPSTSPSPNGAARNAAAGPAKPENPFDPLGLGDALKDLFDGPGKETPSPAPSATAPAPSLSESATAETPAPSESATAGPTPGTPASGGAPGGTTAEPSDRADDPAKEAQDRTAGAMRDAADRAGLEVAELDDDVKGLDAKRDEDIPDGAKQPFPCPTPDPEALAAADLEQGVPLLPTDPWVLRSSLLTLSGLDYKGIVEVRTGDGAVKKVLKFTASSVDIKDLHQTTVGPGGTTGHVEARKGSTSTIRNGTVTMYTQELKGNLFGLIPITFSPRTPPPLNVPFAFFTDVTVVQAGQLGGTLKIPGLHNYFTGAAG
ncbi:hypothetical protein ACPXCE_15095 [Streptomyces sp. DT24]|uniref:hypothetical protein n=1 Tax=Streptomyces sp. DT24 TaxID=3416520 RepID=UPI003CFB371A